jgi:hypothetical protein
MSNENSPAAPVTIDNLPANKGSGGLSAKEFAAIQLSVPMSGTPWLDDMIQEHNFHMLRHKIYVALVPNSPPNVAAQETKLYMSAYVNCVDRVLDDK